MSNETRDAVKSSVTADVPHRFATDVEPGADEIHDPENWWACEDCGYDMPETYDDCLFCNEEVWALR